MEKKGNESGSRKEKILDLLSRQIPIIGIIRNYSKEDAISDFIAGITLGLTMIPQSIAYASLAGLSPQDGLNSAFIGCIIYACFGTIKEVIIGPSSLMALLTYEYTRNLSPDFTVLLCLLSGIVELIMGLVRLGFLVELISAPVVSGFTSATALIIVVSQMKGLLGLRFESNGIVDNIVKLYEQTPNTRYADALLGITCIIFLLLLKKLKCVKVTVKEPYRSVIKKLLWLVSTGRNAIVVLLAALVALHYKKSGADVPFLTSSTSATSIPSIRLPPTSATIGNKTYDFPEMVAELGSGYVIIPIISVLANVAIAKAFVNGPVDATHEMLTLSLCNIAGSFIQSMPTTGAFTRSALANASGIRTTIAGLYTALLTLLALGFLGPIIQYIPKATLSAVLLAAVIFLIDLRIFKRLWKHSWMDLFTLGFTFVCCIVVGVEIGLLFGVAVGLANLIYKWARPEVLVVHKLTGAMGKVIVITPKVGFYFPSVDYIRDTIQKAALSEGKGIEPVIIDCSRLTGSDYSVTMCIRSLKASFDKRGQSLRFVNVPKNCYKLWTTTGCTPDTFITTEETIEEMRTMKKIDEENVKEPEQQELLNQRTGENVV